MNILPLKNEIHCLNFYMVLGNSFINILKHSIERRRACTLVWIVASDDSKYDGNEVCFRMILSQIKYWLWTNPVWSKGFLFTYRNILHILIRDVRVLLKITLHVLSCPHCPLTYQMLELCVCLVCLYALLCLSLLETCSPNTGPLLHFELNHSLVCFSCPISFLSFSPTPSGVEP